MRLGQRTGRRPRRRLCAGWAVAAAVAVLLAAPAGSAEDGSADQPPSTGPEASEQPTARQPAQTTRRTFRGSVDVNAPPILEGSSVDRYGSLVSTVSDRQISDLYAQDLASALRRVPGVVISRYNAVGSYGGGDGGAVYIRGHGAGRPGADILTLTDGIPRFVGIWTHPLLDTLSLDDAARIDVYRSAQPVLLGNMAFGAIDMVSKRRVEHGAGGRFVGSFGGFDTVVGDLEYGGRSDRFDTYLTASHRSSNGHRPNADGEVNAASGRIGLVLGDAWYLSLQLDHTEGDVNDPGAEGAPPIPVVPSYDTRDDFVLATLRHRRGAWEGTYKVYSDRLDADWLQWDAASNGSFVTVTRSRNYGLRLRETTAPWSGGELLLGLDHDVYGGETFERRPTGRGPVTDLSFRNTAPYLMLSQTFGATLTVTPSVGVRYNDSRYFGGDWGGQAGLKVGFGRHAVYANYAHGFNLPGVYAAAMYGGWGRGNQWQDLKAETLDHLEAGWLVGLAEGVRLDVSLFHDRVQDALRFVPPPPPPPQFANVGDYTVRGMEIALQARTSERLDLFVGATFNDSNPGHVPDLPETTAVGGMSYLGAGDWRLNLDVQWVGAHDVLNPRFSPVQASVDAYVLANGRIGVPVAWLGLGGGGELFLVAENLLDERYEYRIGYPMPGRTWQVGVDLPF